VQNQFSFSLFWRRQNCCELMVQLWSRRIRSTERLLEKVPSAEGPDDPGFVGLGPILEDPKHFRSDYVIKQKLQRMRWEEYIAKYGWGIQMIKLSDALPQIVRYGIPDELKSAPTGCFFLSNLSRCSVAHCAPPPNWDACRRAMADIPGQRPQPLDQTRRVSTHPQAV